MKKYCRLIATLLLFILCACNKNTEEPFIVPDEPESIHPDSTIVKLKAIGDFTVGPLSRAGSNDLYALQVTQLHPEETFTNTGKDTVVYGYGWYAIGVFDDLNLAIVKLSKKYNYCFDLAYIPNGKNILQQYGKSSYGNPCSCYYGTPLQVNELRYDTNDWLWMQYGSSQVRGKTSYQVQDNWWNPVCRYQGYLNHFDPNESEVVSIDLYRQVIGFKIVVDDFTKGEVILCGQYDGHTYSIKPAENSSTNTLQIEIETPEIRTPTMNNTDTPLHTTVRIIYDDGEGNQIPLYVKTMFEYERNSLYTLRFSLSDAIANGGITTNIIDDSNDMKEFPIEI